MNAPIPQKLLLSGNEAVAEAALDCGVTLGTGYPGTPSTDILEHFAKIGGKAQWAPNEKVAMEVGLGVAFSKSRSLVTMKHVGVNVAADPLFTSAYTGVDGGMVIITADDPGMASSQNEQDNRRYAVAAGIPMLEPSNSQEAYEFTFKAFEISEKWNIPVFLRMTTRICHALTGVEKSVSIAPPAKPGYEKNIQSRVMIPAFARPAHVKLRQKLADIEVFNDDSDLNTVTGTDSSFGIITSGVTFMHCREAMPDAKILKIGMCYPLPIQSIREFAKSVDRCMVIEEGDPYLVEAIRAAGISVEGKAEMFRFGELNVKKVRKIIDGDTTEPPAIPRGKAPELCAGCPHQTSFNVLNKLGCIVAGDIGCYTLGVLPPYSGMDTCICMGASIGIGLGLRHSLPREQAIKVVSVIGDGTFAHSGMTGLMEMMYNRPEYGHLVIILDNGTTAMTGMQESPTTGRALDHSNAPQISLEGLVKACGVEYLDVIDPYYDQDRYEELIKERLASEKTAVIIARRQCVISNKKIKAYEKEQDSGCQEGGCDHE
ncbi:MAG: thiamine pyrophosphate-binding protein [SAR324 cluster bacterium]|nr:thiamine pyrophosphate-binding protein [SAR324 cluster bacterium]